MSVSTKKKPPVMTECEVKVRGRWLPCTLYEALTERDEIMRCKYCHGPVQASRNPVTEPELISNTFKDTLAAGCRLARSVESSRNIPSR
jgi:hypothetical protein